MCIKCCSSGLYYQLQGSGAPLYKLVVYLQQGHSPTSNRSVACPRQDSMSPRRAHAGEGSCCPCSLQASYVENFVSNFPQCMPYPWRIDNFPLVKLGDLGHRTLILPGRSRWSVIRDFLVILGWDDRLCSNLKHPSAEHVVSTQRHYGGAKVIAHIHNDSS